MESYLNMEGINLFVKILVYVKIFVSMEKDEGLKNTISERVTTHFDA